VDNLNEIANNLRKQGNELIEKGQRLIDAANLIEGKANDLIIPFEYNAALTWEDTCLYILNEYGAMFAQEVAAKAMELNHGHDKATADERVTYNLSKLKMAGKIKAVGKSGRKFKYSL
jgi:hypothetical protein